MAHVDGAIGFGGHGRRTGITETDGRDFARTTQFVGSEDLLGVGIVVVVGDRQVVGGSGAGGGADGVEVAIIADEGGEGTRQGELRTVGGAAKSAHIDFVCGGGVEAREADAIGVDKLVGDDVARGCTAGDTVVAIVRTVPGDLGRGHGDMGGTHAGRTWTGDIVDADIINSTRSSHKGTLERGGVLIEPVEG